MQKHFIIAYDISDAKRVSKIGKLVEKYAMRIQLSIYLYEQVTQNELMILIENIVSLMDENEDDLRIYRVKNRGISIGKAIDLDNTTIIK